MGLALIYLLFFFFSFFPSTTWDLSERTAAGEFRKADSHRSWQRLLQLNPAARPARLHQDSTLEVKAAAPRPAQAAVAGPLFPIPFLTVISLLLTPLSFLGEAESDLGG